jgi:hypothetical protein
MIYYQQRKQATSIEKTRHLLYEYAGKGLVENLDPTFFSKTIPFIDIGDDKVRK